MSPKFFKCKNKGKQPAQPEARQPGQTPDNSSSEHKQPIITGSIGLGTWHHLTAENVWGQAGWELSRLKVVSNIQGYSIYPWNDVDERHCGHSNPDLKLAEMRYGTVQGIMGNTQCLFLILRIKHDGPGSPRYIESIRESYVTVQLLHQSGQRSPLTMINAMGIPALKARLQTETYLLMGVGYAYISPEAIEHIFPHDLEVGASICVTMRKNYETHEDHNLCNAWKSGEVPAQVF